MFGSLNHKSILSKLLLVDPLNYHAKVTKLRFLSRMRSIALVIQILCIFPGMHYQYLSNQNLDKYVGIIFISSLFNAFMALRLRSLIKLTDRVIFFNLIFDLGVLSILLYLSGGWNNPFMSLYFFHACLGALLLQGCMSVAFFVFLACCMYFCFSYTCNPGFRYWFTSLPREVIFLSELFISFIIWLLSFWLRFILNQLQVNIDRLNQRHSRFERLRAVGALAAGFSHRLASPLNNIRLRMDRFKRLHPDMMEDMDLQSLLGSVNDCDRVFKDFFLEQVPFSEDILSLTEIKRFIEQVVQSWQHDNPEILVHCACCGIDELSMHIPELAMARSLMDLLDNAKNAQQSARQARIEIFLTCLEHDLLIQIRDFGEGVPAKIIERLGEPFLSGRQGGTGLGLFTAAGLVQSLGGELKIENAKLCGALVNILLPLEGCRSNGESRLQKVYL